MASPSQALRLRFSTDLEPAKRGLIDLASTAGTQLALVSASAIGAARQIDATSASFVTISSVLSRGLQFFAAYKVAVLGVTAGIAALSAALDIAADQVEKLQHIARGAQAAGVSSTFFQVWRNQATELNVEIGALEKALEHAKRAVRETVGDDGKDKINSITRYLDELYRGGRVQGVGLGNFLSAGDTEQKVSAVLTAMRELLAAGRDIEALHLAEMLTGAPELAERLTEAVKAGKVNMSELIGEAQRSGSIFDAEMVQRADELDERLRKAKATMAEGMAPVLKDLGSLGLDIKDGWVQIEEVMARVVVIAGRIYSAVKSLRDIIPDVDKLLERFGNWVVPKLEAVGAIDDKATREQNIARVGLAHPGIFGGQMTAEQTREALGLINPSRSILNGYDLTPSAGALDAARTAPAPPRRPSLSQLETPAAAAPAAHSARGSSTPAASVDQVETYLNQLRKSVEVLETEAAAHGKSNLEKEKAIDLAKAEAAARERGRPLTEQEIADTERLAERRVVARKRVEDLTKAETAAREQMKFFGDAAADAFERAIQGGANLNDTLQSLLKSIESAVLKAALLGEGPLAGLFGTKGENGALGGFFGAIGSIAKGSTGEGGFLSNLFSGKFASGGTIPAGRWGVVGEHGPEPVYAGDMPLSVMPSAMARAAMGAARGGSGATAAPSEIHIHQSANTSASVKESRTPQGGRRTDIQVVEAVTGVMQSPQGHAAFRQMGMRPKLPKW